MPWPPHAGRQRDYSEPVEAGRDATSWTLASEALEETLASGAAPSLERLGRLGQLGALAALVGALGDEDALAAAAIAHARERESLGLEPGEVVGELLALGRVLDRHGLARHREALDWCLLLFFERVTAELGERVRRDPLTGVLNHRAFHALVASEVARARRYRGRLTLVLFDLDHFKETNDREGHAEGDRLLRAFAAALGETVRENDAIGRLGGDEFGVLLVQAEAWAVDAFLARLRKQLPSEVSASAGTASIAEVTGPPEALFALADRRLYEDKLVRAA
jgi:diguanylate cyclase (GGDEF)-like protein